MSHQAESARFLTSRGCRQRFHLAWGASQLQDRRSRALAQQEMSKGGSEGYFDAGQASSALAKTNGTISSGLPTGPASGSAPAMRAGAT